MSAQREQLEWSSLAERARVASGLAEHARRLRVPTWDVLAAWAERCRREAA